MPYDLDSFDEVEASEGDFDSIHSEYGIALADAQTAILKSEELCKRYDPDDEPYKSKYLAREALKIAILKLQPHTEKNASISKESRTIARDTVARLNWRLAAIYMDVQEAGGAKEFLELSLNHWRPRVITEINKITVNNGKASEEENEPEVGGDEEDMIIAELVSYCRDCEVKEKKNNPKSMCELEVVEAISHLGIYHHNFEHFKQGLILLKLCDELMMSLDTDKDDVRALKTQVCFYLAQAYSAMKRPHDGAHYCQLTLEWQLATEPLNAPEWYKNCAGLVDYFMNQDRYRDAEHCLRACDFIIETRMSLAAAPAARRTIDETAERLAEARADMDRRWGIFHLNILQDAAREFGEERSEPEGTVNFSALNLPASDALLPSQVVSFDEARVVFKAAMSRHHKAQQFYVLDGYVTDNIALCRDISAMYKWLSCFEPDEKRKIAMLGRRAAVLSPILDELGVSAYAGELKQISFEVAEIYMEMCEIKLERIAQKRQQNSSYQPKSAEIAKSNEYAQESIKTFERFTNFFRKAAPVPLFPMPNKNKDEESDEDEYDDEEDRKRKAKKREDKKKAAEDEALGGKLDIPPDELAVCLRAHFYIARLYGKLLPVPGAQGEARVVGLKQSLQKYEWLRKFAREQIDLLPKTKPKPTLLSDPDEVFINPETCFKDELGMCDQMVELLPLQINRSFYLNEDVV
jgi:hypothetical protein